MKTYSYPSTGTGIPCGPVNNTRPSPPLCPFAVIARDWSLLVHPWRGSIKSSRLVCLLPVQEVTINGWLCIFDRKPSEGIQILMLCGGLISNGSWRKIVTWTGLLSSLSGYLKISPTVGVFFARIPLRYSSSPPSNAKVATKVPAVAI